MAKEQQLDPQKLVGFAPDLDPATPGIFRTCNNIIPTAQGFKSAASPVSSNMAALPAPVVGSALIARLNGTDRQFAGTASKLYENQNGTWVDVSRSSSYALGSTAQWRFTAFGNMSLAVNGTNLMQAALDGAFADIANSPTGQIVFVANYQVFVCNTTAAPGGQFGPHYWHCSGVGDHTQWDYTNQQTLCAYAPLGDTAGGITAGTALGPNAILFKTNSMYVGTLQGYPTGWGFEAISKQVGALCQEAVVNTGSALFFIGSDDFYAYQNNSLPQPIGGNVRRWFFNTISPAYKNKISSYYDQDQQVIYWAFVSNNSANGAFDSCITYNWKTGTWGVMNLNMQGFMQILNGQITFNSIGNQWVTYDALPAISYDSSFWINFRITPGYFDNTNTLYALAGASKGATISTNTFGDTRYYSTLKQFFLMSKQQPASGTAVWKGVTAAGTSDPSSIATAKTGAFVPADSRIDVDQNARWHGLDLTLTGDFEIMEWFVTLSTTGKN
ncbi:hypothetical protein AWB76_00944 [Caballeronia temeraria]|uniref:Uncharacterized protein n=1 Tax=Caballeronia temeraria TaxID=1777137 RepID=A0A157ZM75_9BURK|nr:hypothetical protein [Caballeronia temeraria]SAK46615.1 hypothetical protein AWB76_00944 [Caballeronia temeraria]